MHRKKSFIVIILLAILAGITVYGISYGNNKIQCIRLRDGNVKVEFEYSKNLFSLKTPGNYIELFEKPKTAMDSSDLILTIDSYYFETVDTIVSDSLIEQGPDFKKDTLNGYEAASYIFNNDDLGEYRHYKIPLGDRVIEVLYHPSKFFTSEEKIVAEVMLKSITFKEEPEDIKGKKVEKCSLF